LKAAKPQILLRAAVAADAPALLELIAAHLEEGRLLPRSLDELTVHAPRFVVAVQGERIVGCAELAPLSQKVAEIRSLVVSSDARKLGLGNQMVEALAVRARNEEFNRLCAFAHDPAFFVHRGFSIVPHTWVPEKIAHDCTTCPLFRNCGQFAIVLELDRSVDAIARSIGGRPAHV
jgi:amino-acid N-acetyltransferase